MDNEKEIESSLEYWLHAISLKAPDSAVIVVGTHLDQVGEKGRLKQPPPTLITKFSKLITLSINVSCTTGEGIDKLRDYLLILAMERKIKLPAKWIRFGNFLYDQSFNGASFIEMEKVRKLAHHPTLELNDDILFLAIQVLHNIGYLLYYPPSSNNESNIIILDPQWLVNILKAVVTVNEVPGINGG